MEPANLNFDELKSQDVFGPDENELYLDTDTKEDDNNLPLTGFNANNLFLDKLFGEALQQLVNTNRRRRHFGVYDECCRKPCSYNELLSYCL